MHKCSLSADTYPHSGHLAPDAQKQSRLEFMIGSLGDAPNYDDEHDCDSTDSQMSDGSRTAVGSSRFSYKSGSEKMGVNRPSLPASGSAVRSSHVERDLYRYSYRMVQHPYSQRTSYTSRYVNDPHIPATSMQP